MSVIKVENLSKKYIIDHEGQERYIAMRDVVARKVKKIFSIKKLLTPKVSNTKEEFYALRDINFEIAQGDRVGIIGRNGAGKSTLLKVLSRITEPTTGKISINGRVASLLEVGTGFHPELSGRENIFLNGAILGMSRAEIKKHFDAIVDFSGVEKFLDTPVKRFSSGMYVRLAFAVAAHLEPEILIIDEVLAVGDAEFQKKCLGKMEDVSKNEGRTILFVSHNVPAVRNLTEKIIYLKNGKIEAIGKTSEMLDMYIEDTIRLTLENKDTNHYRRSERNPLASIRSVIVNKIINEFPRVGLNQDIKLSITIDAARNISSPDLNIIFKNIQAEVVTTIASRDNGFYKDLNEGENIIELIVESNYFAPGKYFATIGIGPNSGELSFDVITDYPLFEVYNDGKITYWPDRPFGSFFTKNIKWQ